MTTFTAATVTGGSATDRQFVLTALDAASAYLEPVLGGSATVDVALVLGPLPWPTVAYTGSIQGELQADGKTVIPDAVLKMQGQRLDDGEPDAIIQVDVAKLAAEPNAILVMAHELLTTLSFNGDPAAEYVTPFDDLIQETAAGPVFVGAFAEGVNGGPVALVPWDIQRYAQPGLMDPFAGGALSLLDLAVLADTGVPLAGSFV